MGVKNILKVSYALWDEGKTLYTFGLFWIFYLDMWFSTVFDLINVIDLGYRFFEIRIILIYWRKTSSNEVFWQKWPAIFVLHIS